MRAVKRSAPGVFEAALRLTQYALALHASRPRARWQARPATAARSSRFAKPAYAPAGGGGRFRERVLLLLRARGADEGREQALERCAVFLPERGFEGGALAAHL